jgi:hypothetical protein
MVLTHFIYSSWLNSIIKKKYENNNNNKKEKRTIRFGKSSPLLLYAWNQQPTQINHLSGHPWRRNMNRAMEKNATKVKECTNLQSTQI